MTRSPRLGSHILESGSTQFTVWAPKQRHLNVLFPESDRTEPMIATERGYFQLTTQAPAGTLYQIQLANGDPRPDPASAAQPQGVHGPSMVLAPQPTPPLFLCPELREHVLYELHVGTFTPEGTFDAIIQRLPALRTLGITAIELMPVAQFPGDRNWGYDGVLPFAAQWSYGGRPGLQRLVNACHQQGLSVILDVVYNHLGPEGNYLADFGPYFTDRYKTPWGAALNFDGPFSDEVREYFIQSSLRWTLDCGIDGLRLDAVHAIVDHTATPFIQELTARNHEEAQRRGRRVLIIAESSDNDPRLLRDPAHGGIGMDGCWNDDYHHAVRSALTGERRGYYASYGEPSQIAKALRDRYVFTGAYAPAFKRRHGAPASNVPPGKFVAFTQNHDHVGNRPQGDRLEAAAGPDGARVAAALVLLSPFTPLLWMGEEYADSAPFQYFVSHSDPQLIDAVRKGRAAEFADFHESAHVPDPQDPNTFARSKLQWSLRGSGRHAQTLAYYAALITLRHDLGLPQRSATVSSGSVESVVWLAYRGRPMLLLLANTGAAPTSFSPRHITPAANWDLLLASDDPRWGGSGAAALPADAKDDIMINARTALLLRAGDSE